MKSLGSRIKSFEMPLISGNSFIHVVYDNCTIAVSSAIAAWLFTAILYRLAFHPLAAYPGPLLARISTIWQFYQDVILGGRMSYTLRQLHDTYGPIVRIAPNCLHIADPEFYLQYTLSNSMAINGTS